MTDGAVLAAPLEDLVCGGSDPYIELRAEWERVGVGGLVAVRYGVGGGRRLRRPEVEALLRLAGFVPESVQRTASGYRMEARAGPRTAEPLSCSVIVPCRDEIGNIDDIVRRVPPMGRRPGSTSDEYPELVFVDGASRDGTPQRIEALMHIRSDRDIKLLHQRGGGGKAAAVYQGFDAAGGDVLVILDADMTVAPEDLPRFYLALAEGVTQFANGTRFVYPMEPGAMPAANNAGNRAFAVLLSWLIGSQIGDTLCGTKALFKRDWPSIAQARALFGGHDPWGDFDLLLSAAYVGLQPMDVPIRYGARSAGESKMRPVRHGLALTQTCLAGIRRLKL